MALAALVDCLVIGGGVAGACLSLLLARRGVSVVLVDHGRLHASGPFETLLGSSRPLLERLQLLPVLTACAQPDPLRHGAIWGSDEPSWRGDEAPGWLLARGAFDHGLRTLAAAAGAVVYERRTAMPVADTGEWQLRGADGELRLRPRTVVVATGRTGRGGGQPTGPRTLAFTLIGSPAARDRGTAMVEATAEGWLWTHVPRHGAASAAVLLDAEQCRREGRELVLARALVRSRGPAGRILSPRLRHATDASAVFVPPTDRWLRIGDAAASIDPLASQGVEKAIAAADQAAAAVATALAEPALWPRLLAGHAQWERELAQAHGAAAGAWYARESRFADAPFWRARQPSPPPEWSPHDALRAAAELQPAEVLVRRGDRFVVEPGLEHRGTGDRRSHCGFVPLAPLLAAFAPPRTLAAGVAAAGREPRLFVLPPRAVWQAAVALRQWGWLQPVTAASPMASG
jgi:flavin-dependent dehydrogenase